MRLIDDYRRIISSPDQTSFGYSTWCCIISSVRWAEGVNDTQDHFGGGLAPAAIMGRQRTVIGPGVVHELDLSSGVAVGEMLAGETSIS